MHHQWTSGARGTPYRRAARRYCGCCWSLGEGGERVLGRRHAATVTLYVASVGGDGAVTCTRLLDFVTAMNMTTAGDAARAGHEPYSIALQSEHSVTQTAKQ